MREGDKKQPGALKILELQKQGTAKNLYIASSAFLEISLGFRETVEWKLITETFRNLRGLTSIVKEVPMNSAIMSRAMDLQAIVQNCDLYHSLHAATAIEIDEWIISDDVFYDTIPNLRRTTLTEYIDDLEPAMTARPAGH